MRFWFICLFTLWLGAAASAQEKRLALVIGNEDYPAAVGQLTNPHEDAELIAEALEDVGFEIVGGVQKDATRAEMWAGILSFQTALKNAGNEAVGFVYYSGHGGSYEGRNGRSNYFIPSQSPILTADQLPALGISLDAMLTTLEATDAHALIVVSDACRNTLPWASNMGGAQPDKGFAPQKASPGTLLAYSTADGDTAPDDRTYARSLAKHLRMPNLSVDRVFTLIGREVAATRPGGETPVLSDQLRQDFYFKRVVAPPRDQSAGISEDAERALFLAAQSCEDYQSYVERYPRGDFLSAAEVILGSSRCNASAPTTTMSTGTMISAEAAAEALKAGQRAYDSKDYVTARLEYTKACDGGLAKGCTNLGVLYRNGYGVTQDYAQARSFYQKGCNGGNALGCTNLAFLYANGYGVAQDYAQARPLYQKGCDGGSAVGCTNLGILYGNGYGVAQDYAQARPLYQKGCDGGSAGGCTNLGFLYANGYGVARDDAQARTLYKKGCDSGDALGCSNLGNMLYQGRGGPEDQTRGIELVRQGCAGGHQWGCDWLEERDLSR